jgi:hypothetical protein
MPKIITARYGGRCQETKKRYTAGSLILIDMSTKKTWCTQSEKYKAFIGAPEDKEFIQPESGRSTNPV